MPDKNLLIVLGATAVGKTKLAVQLAHTFNGEIISADSRQVFRDMDIGTGKDLSEYEINGQKIPYHLINIKAAGEHYQVNAFKQDFFGAFEKVKNANKLPILCGGTGMYIHSLLQNHELTAVPVNNHLRGQLGLLSKQELQHELYKYPTELTQQADTSSHKRLVRAIEIAEYLTHHSLSATKKTPLNPLVIGLFNEVDIRRNKILARLDDRLSNGLVEEVQNLLNKGLREETLIFYGLEYKFVVSYLKKEISFDTLRERLGIAICQFAKRQMTFFRKMEKDGVKINWVEAIDNENLVKNRAIDLVEKQYFNSN